MKALDFANYIVTKQIDEYSYTNTISLQKVLYFVNAKYMEYKREATPLFDDSIQKWKYGPVVPEVYQEYKPFGAMDITALPTSQFFFWDQEEFLEELVEECGIKKEIIDEWIDNFVDRDRFELVDLTHDHQVWRRDAEKIKDGQLGISYDNEEIFREMESNPDRFFEGEG